MLAISLRPSEGGINLLAMLLGFFILVATTLFISGVIALVEFLDDPFCRTRKDYIKKWHNMSKYIKFLVITGAIGAGFVAIALTMLVSYAIGIIVLRA